MATSGSAIAEPGAAGTIARCVPTDGSWARPPGWSLLLVGAVALTQWVDGSTSSRASSRRVSAPAGDPSRCRGGLELDWFPWLALRTGAGSVGNPPGVAGPPLLAWREASFGARLLPLLRGELELDRVRLVGARLALQRGADGRDNWSRLGAGARARRWRLAAARGPRSRGLSCSCADATDGTDLLLDGLQLETGAYVAGCPEPVKMLVRFGLRDPVASGGSAMRASRLRSRCRRARPWCCRSAAARWRRGVSPRVCACGRAVLARPARRDTRARSRCLARRRRRTRGRALRNWSCAGSPHEQPGEAPPTAVTTFALALTSLRELLTVVGIEPPVTTDRTGRCWRASPRRTNVAATACCGSSLFALTLDDTHFEGSVVRGGKPPTAEVALAGDTLDIDRYLEPEGTPGEPFHFRARHCALRARGTLERARFDDIGFRRTAGATVAGRTGLRGDPAAATSAGTPAKSGAARGARR